VNYLSESESDSNHNYNVVIQNDDDWVDVSNCNSWLVAMRNEGTEPGHTF